MKDKTFVLKGKDIVGEAVVLRNQIYVHYYDSYGSYSYKKLPKNLKLKLASELDK